MSQDFTAAVSANKMIHFFFGFMKTTPGLKIVIFILWSWKIILETNLVLAIKTIIQISLSYRW